MPPVIYRTREVERSPRAPELEMERATKRERPPSPVHPRQPAVRMAIPKRRLGYQF